MSCTTSSPDAWIDAAPPPNPPLAFFTNDFPSDAGDVLRSLQRHSKDARCRHLASMLSMCNRAVREEVARLPKTWQRHVPPVDDLLALFNDTAFREGPLGGSMEGVFLCIFQLGCIITFVGAFSAPSLPTAAPAC